MKQLPPAVRPHWRTITRCEARPVWITVEGTLPDQMDPVEPLSGANAP